MGHPPGVMEWGHLPRGEGGVMPHDSRWTDPPLNRLADACENNTFSVHGQ